MPYVLSISEREASITTQTILRMASVGRGPIKKSRFCEHRPRPSLIAYPATAAVRPPIKPEFSTVDRSRFRQTKTNRQRSNSHRLLKRTSQIGIEKASCHSLVCGP